MYIPIILIIFDDDVCVCVKRRKFQEKFLLGKFFQFPFTNGWIIRFRIKKKNKTESKILVIIKRSSSEEKNNFQSSSSSFNHFFWINYIQVQMYISRTTLITSKFKITKKKFYLKFHFSRNSDWYIIFHICMGVLFENKILFFIEQTNRKINNQKSMTSMEWNLPLTTRQTDILFFSCFCFHIWKWVNYFFSVFLTILFHSLSNIFLMADTFNSCFFRLRKRKN